MRKRGAFLYMKLLILATATNQRLIEVIDEAINLDYTVTFLVQEKRKIFFEAKYPGISIVGTDTDYIEYKAVINEHRIKRAEFNEIWIPSGFSNNMDSFGEAITLALDLKAKKVLWKAPNGKNILVNKPTVKEKLESYLLWIAYLWGKYTTRIQSKVMGYKW